MATNTKRKSQQRSSSQSSSSGLFSIVLSFFIGYAIAHVFDMNFIGRQINQAMPSRDKNKIQQAQTKHTLPKPKFEYYALLAKEGHSNHHNDDTKKSAIEVTQANPLAPIKEDDHLYVLQLASYFKKADAERMKAELILQGHVAKIEEHKTENRIIYRLMVGPFKRKTEAEKEQVDLARQLHVMGMIRRTQIS